MKRFLHPNPPRFPYMISVSFKYYDKGWSTIDVILKGIEKLSDEVWRAKGHLDQLSSYNKSTGLEVV